MLAVVAQNQRVSRLIWEVCMSDATARNAQEAILFPYESLSTFSEDLQSTETTRYLCVAATHSLHGKSLLYPVPRLSLWSILPSAGRSWHEKAGVIMTVMRKMLAVAYRLLRTGEM